MNKRTRHGLTAALALATAVGFTATADAAIPAHDRTDRPAAQRSGNLATAFAMLERNTAWQQTGTLKLNFPTFHPQGLAVAGDRVFLSSVEILEPTVRFPTPQGRYDRTPGKGVGHLFVMDRKGNLLKDIVLGEGDAYHPGGIDFDGTNIWVPVAEYRPDSSSIMYRVNASTLRVHKQFEYDDHVGGVVLDRTTGRLVGNTWGSRRFVEWTRKGLELDVRQNPSFFIDYQDCQYVVAAKMICGGVTNLPQTPAAGGTAASYELGGMAMIDLRSHDILREVPFQKWSSAGHVATRNPLHLMADGNRLTLMTAPDDYEERNGTEILTYQATVAPPAR
jgi:hypothetical protein